MAALVLSAGNFLRGIHTDSHDIGVMVLLVADRRREVSQQPERNVPLDRDFAHLLAQQRHPILEVVLPGRNNKLESRHSSFLARPPESQSPPLFPHGLGHLLGLSVHDITSVPYSREPSDDPVLAKLGPNRVLERGMVTTVEPGIYFIDALLGDPARREKFAESVVWERADELRGFGGIRIEDDVLVTDGDPEGLTAAIAKPLRIG